MLLQTLGHFKGLLYKYDGIIIDDPLFKMHYCMTNYLLLFSSVLVTGKVYFGSPIQCSLYFYDFTKLIPPDMLNSYCYIKSTFIIPKPDRDVIESYPGIFAHTSDEARDYGIQQSFYQWIPLLLFIQGLTFFVPKLLWSSLEGGKVKGLRFDLHQPYVEEESARKSIGKIVSYFKENCGCHSLYGKGYIYCNIIGLANIILQFFVTNWVLKGNFIAYGLNFSYGNSAKGIPNHEDVIFPKMSKCQIHLFGPSGTKELLDGLCVLPLNILHDKIFLVLWYWYILILIFTSASLIYWVSHYFNRAYRLKHIERHLKGTATGNHLKPFNSNFGDWFLLHLMYKNIQHSYFIRVVSKLCSIERRELKKTATNIKFHLSDEEDEEQNLH